MCILDVDKVMYFELKEYVGIGGDVEATLRSGFAMWDDLDDGATIYIERTGPFVPLIYLVGDQLICQTEVKEKILANNFLGISFTGPLELRKVVKFDISNCNECYDFINRIESLGEFNAYDLIENGEHDATLAAAMPKLWRMDCDFDANIRMVSGEDRSSEEIVSFYAADSFDKILERDIFFSHKNYIGIFVSEPVKKLLDNLAPNCLLFNPINIFSEKKKH